MPRTNNYIEGFHNALRPSVTNVRPNIWSLITALKHEEALSATRIPHRNRGDSVTLKKKYKDADQRTNKLLVQYVLSNETRYLRGIAHNIKHF